MKDYDAIVVGAGNGGISAACALAKAGVKTLLLEQHNIPGGCATSFCRGRFEFEVALHQLSGLGSVEKPGPLRRVLDDLGVTDQVEWVAMKNLYRVIVPGQLDSILPAEREGAITVLKDRFPKESQAIEAFFDLMYQYYYDSVNIYYKRDVAASPEKYPDYFKYAMKTVQEVMEEYFADPLLKLALSIYWLYLGLPSSTMPFPALAALLVLYFEYKPFHIKNGSQALSNAIVNKFMEYGGTVRYNCRVDKILVENGRVIGVVIDNGETIRAQHIVSNASPVSVFTEYIEIGQVPKGDSQRLKSKSIGPSCITLYVGLDCNPSEVGINETTNFICPDADIEEGYNQTRCIDAEKDHFMLTVYNMEDPGFAPEGTSNISIVTIKYGDPWLAIPPEEYFETKYEIAKKLLDRVEEIFPGFQEHIEEIETSTPITHARYLCSPGGGAYGFDKFIKDSPLFNQKSFDLKGIHFVGAWSGAGAGFQPTLMSGPVAARTIIQEVAEQKGVK